MALQSYGPAINRILAKQIATGALEHAQQNEWNVACAIVDNHGFLVYYERMDDTQTGSATICVEKAKTAAMFRRPTKAFDAGVNGRTSLLSFGGKFVLFSFLAPIPYLLTFIPTVNMCEGGIPIVQDGKVIGGIGVSGVNSNQDAACAEAGLAFLAP